MFNVVAATTGDKPSLDLARLNTSQTTSHDPKLLFERFYHLQKVFAVFDMLVSIGNSTGGFVELRKEYNYFPVLMGNNNRPVPLFAFVEVLDETIDYDRLKEELPTLSYSQISGAITFLRKVAQFNPYGIDVDEAEDEISGSEKNLLDELEAGLADQEIARVLHHDKQDR